MKKITLCLLALATSIAGFAYRGNKGQTARHVSPPLVSQVQYKIAGLANKSTADGDTSILTNLPDTAHLVAYTVGSTVDSGYIFGTNAFNDQGFAERYDFNGSDSALQVLGVIGQFSGHYSTTNPLTVNFKVWTSTPRIPTSSPNIFFNGFPDSVKAAASVLASHLGIDNNGVQDTGVIVGFAPPTSFLGSSFFVGYDMSYSFAPQSGNNFSIVTSADGERQSPLFTVEGSDTIVYVQNATRFNLNGDTAWHDNVFENTGIRNDLFILPVVVVRFSPADVNVVNKNLTFYGNYPNPAVGSTNIRFALKNKADVTIRITDMTGKVVSTIVQTALTSGEHTIAVSTTGLAAGNYIYSIRSSNGGGIASLLTVVK